jgi:hypothetical protein
MAKRQQRNQDQGPPPRQARRYGTPYGQGLAFATLGGVVVLLMISFSNWREIDGIEERLDRRLGEIETSIGQLADKVEKIPVRAAQPAAHRGPDPNKVYEIKTNGAPALGPATAPVTIAEFSDFQ